MSIQVTKCSHTLYDPNFLYKKNSNKPCLTYQSFQSLISKVGEPDRPLAEPDKFPSAMKHVNDSMYRIPTLSEIGVDESTCGPLKFPGVLLKYNI